MVHFSGLALLLAFLTVVTWAEQPEAATVDRYEELCSGQPQPQQIGTKCEYMTRGHPYLLIGPLKAELVNVNPAIYMLHEVIYDSEIKVLQELASAQFDLRTGEPIRLTTVTWLRSHQHKVLQRLDGRIEIVTGLDPENVEPMQITNYGLGDRFMVHHDAVNVYDEDLQLESGNRIIATCIFYMHDVESGGGTIFLNLNLTVWPRKGSALFWYNLHEDGVVDDRMVHAACTIFAGTKWVANKFIRERGQEFKRPCKLHQNSVSSSNLESLKLQIKSLNS